MYGKTQQNVNSGCPFLSIVLKSTDVVQIAKLCTVTAVCTRFLQLFIRKQSFNDTVLFCHKNIHVFTVLVVQVEDTATLIKTKWHPFRGVPHEKLHLRMKLQYLHSRHVHICFCITESIAHNKWGLGENARQKASHQTLFWASKLITGESKISYISFTL